MIMNRVRAECCGDYFIAVSLGGVINLIRSTFFHLPVTREVIITTNKK